MESHNKGFKITKTDKQIIDRKLSELPKDNPNNNINKFEKKAPVLVLKKGKDGYKFDSAKFKAEQNNKMMSGMMHNDHFQDKQTSNPKSFATDKNPDWDGLTQEEINMYNKMDLKALEREVADLDFEWKERNTKIEGISLRIYGERSVLREKERHEAELNKELNEIKRKNKSKDVNHKSMFQDFVVLDEKLIQKEDELRTARRTQQRASNIDDEVTQHESQLQAQA